MDRLLILALLLTPAAARANPVESSSIDVLAFLLLPLILTALMSWSGYGEIRVLRGEKRWTLAARIAYIVIGFPLMAVFAFFFTMMLGAWTAGRGLEMINHGVRALRGKTLSPNVKAVRIFGLGPKPPEGAQQDIPYPAWTRPRRLIASGVLCILAAGFFGLAAPLIDELPFQKNLLRKSFEGATKGNLGLIRAAVDAYRIDHKDAYPDNFAALLDGGKYLARLPESKPANYHKASSVLVQAQQADDAGGWFYDNVVGDKNFGGVYVNCTHTDTRGTTWTSY